MGDWVLNLRMPWYCPWSNFATTYLIAGGVYLVVTRLAVNERAKAFKAVTPGVLSPIGHPFCPVDRLHLAVEVWTNFDKGKGRRGHRGQRPS